MGRQPDAETGADRNRTRRYLVWAALLIAVLVPFVLIEGPGAGVLRSLGVVDRDESFTELFFPDRSALPTTVVTGGPLDVDFSVRNREGSATRYRWQARLGPVGSETVVVAHGRLRLTDGEARTVHVTAVAAGAPAASALSVVLVGRTEAIHFPLTIVPAGSGLPAGSGSPAAPGAAPGSVAPPG